MSYPARAEGLVNINSPRDRGSIPGLVISKTQKLYLRPPCLTLSTIRQGSRESGAILEKESHPPLHIGVVAIEKGAFVSPSTTVANDLYIYIYVYIYIYIQASFIKEGTLLIILILFIQVSLFF